MKKLLFAAAAIAILSLLAPSSSIAEPTHPNEIGLYTTPDGYGATGTYVMHNILEVYLVLTKPADTENGNSPYSTIIAFECRLNFNQSDQNVHVLATNFPPTADFNIDNYMPAYVEYSATFDDYPLTGPESVVLISFLFISTLPGQVDVTLGPISSPAIAGQMAFSSVLGEPRIMHPVSGSHDAPVFTFNGEAVVVENESFGSVKALFR